MGNKNILLVSVAVVAVLVVVVLVLFVFGNSEDNKIDVATQTTDTPAQGSEASSSQEPSRQDDSETTTPSTPETQGPQRVPARQGVLDYGSWCQGVGINTSLTWSTWGEAARDLTRYRQEFVLFAPDSNDGALVAYHDLTRIGLGDLILPAVQQKPATGAFNKNDPALAQGIEFLSSALDQLDAASKSSLQGSGCLLQL